VGIDDVDVVEVEALERGAEAFDDVFAREAVVVDEDFAVGAAPVELGCDDEVVAVPWSCQLVRIWLEGSERTVVLLDRLAHDNLGFAARIAGSRQ
jgi:hypothetical protein